MKWVFMLLVVLGTSACTADAWRSSVQESAKNECLKSPIGEQQRCLERLKESQP